MPTFETDRSIDHTVEVSTLNAAELIRAAENLRTRRDRSNRKRFSRLFKDDKALRVTITLTDEVMRIRSTKEAVSIFARAAKDATVKGFGPLNALGLTLGAWVSKITPSAVVSIVHWRVRSLSRDLILPAEKKNLKKILNRRQAMGVRLNINVLGEAVLGNSEAESRLNQILQMIQRPEVDYVSVKLSAVVAQMITIDHEGSLNKVCEKLRILYAAAKTTGTFINLDMEEFRDLALTVDAFKQVLLEDEFLNLNAGIVLQAYLPESHSAFYDLATWAKERHQRAGGMIKIRLVKGANLAMEKAEAEFHGWVAAPYSSKADVDASYSRLIDVALRPELAPFLRIGLASHNLFHLTWAVEVARNRGVLNQLDIEMLEGMANAEALAVVKSGHPVLLYAPVTKQDDFASAVAYLVRRLDENTSDENYLKAAFGIAKNEGKFIEQRERFEYSVLQRHSINVHSKRAARESIDDAGFQNEPSSDPTNHGYLAGIKSNLNSLFNEKYQDIPIVINGKSIRHEEKELGLDPNKNGEVWYRYSTISTVEADLAIEGCSKSSWLSTSAADRAKILNRVADYMSGQRARSISVMARDAGKTVSEADAEVSEGIDFARFYATQIDERQSSPMGTTLVVPPWNFPYAIPAGGVFAALAAGNPVILKPAPETVATAWELVQQMWEGGIPKDSLHFLPSRDDDDGKYLVSHPDIKALILTGAFDTASLFTGWRQDLNLLAETSGKNAILISACADIDLAVKDLVQSAFGHAGQKCSAASLGIVVESIFKDPAFIRQLIDDVSSLKVDPGYELGTTVGPIIKKPEAKLLRALTKLDQGESWLLEPIQLDEAGMMWRPGIKVGVQPGSWSHQNEWFGPVLGIMVAPDLHTAVQWQNATDYGLTAGIHSLDSREIDYWMENIEAGNLYINRGITGAVVNRQPFGGWKQSSVGATAKAGGHHYVNSLRNWEPIQELEIAKRAASKWWKEVGSQAVDYSGLRVEKNFHRYRRPLHPTIVRVDAHTSPEEFGFINFIAEITRTKVEFSYAETEPLSALIESAQGKIRWISQEKLARGEFLARGLSLDARPIAQRGDIEVPRWLLEQSVCITNHRYGNINAGPKPACPGLG